MAFTKIDNNKEIVFDPNFEMGGGPSSYFHFIDLAKIRHEHPDARGFRITKGTIDGEECALLVLVAGLTQTGAQQTFDQDGDFLAISCPRVIDQKGGINYEDLNPQG